MDFVYVRELCAVLF